MPFDQLMLRDVQGLFGGRNLFVRASGECVLQHVVRGQQETRYVATLSAADLEALSDVLRAHDLAAVVPPPPRPPVPDEAHPYIRLLRGSTTVGKSKRANDKVPHFDEIYAALLRVAKAVQDGEVVFRGPHDGRWTPEGF